MSNDIRNGLRNSGKKVMSTCKDGDSAVQLIRVDSENEKLEITNEGIDYLMGIKSNRIVIVSVIGEKDKSNWNVCNGIIGEGEVFKERETDMKGVFAIAKQLHSNSNSNNGSGDDNTVMLLLDVEGCSNYDKQLYMMCMLISSCVIYNCVSDDIKVCMNNFIELHNKAQTQAQINTNNINSSQLMFLFKNAINNSNSNAITHNTILTNTYSHITTHQTSSNIHNILPTLSPKTINNLYVTGECLYGLFQELTDLLNSDTPININKTFTNILSLCIEDNAILLNSNITYNSLQDTFTSNNIYDNTKLIFDTLLSKQLKSLSSTPICASLNANIILDAVQLLTSKLIDVYETLFTQSKDNFSSLINSFSSVNSIYNGETIPNINLTNIEEYFTLYTKYLHDIFINLIFKFSAFDYNEQLLSPLFNSIVIDNITHISKQLNKEVERVVNENNKLRNEICNMKETIKKIQKNKDDEILKLKLKCEMEQRDKENKEIELRKFESEREKYEEMLKKERTEKERLEKKLRDSLKSITNEQGGCCSCTEGNVKEVNDLKEKFDDVTKVFFKFQTAVNLIEDNNSGKNFFMENIYIEKSIQQLEMKYADVLDLLREKNALESLAGGYEKEIMFLKKVIKDLEVNMHKQIDTTHYYKDKCKELSDKLEQVLTLYERS